MTLDPIYKDHENRTSREVARFYSEAYFLAGQLERVLIDASWKAMGFNETFTDVTEANIRALIALIKTNDKEALRFSQKMDELLKKQAAFINMVATTVERCSLCQSELTWKTSGKGKVIAGRCPTHGFVTLKQHPIMDFVKEPEERKPGIFTRLFRFLF